MTWGENIGIAWYGYGNNRDKLGYETLELWDEDMGVSINRCTPKWMVYKGTCD